MNKMARIEQIIKDTPQGENVYHELRENFVSQFEIPQSDLERIEQMIWNLTPQLSVKEMDALPGMIRKYHPDFPFKSFSPILWWATIQVRIAEEAIEELSHGGMP